MTPKSKKKQPSSSSSSFEKYQNMTLDELADLHNDTDSEDEEINEDEAFNSEDEEVYGKYLSSGVSSKIRSKNLSLSMPLLKQSDDSTNTVRIVEIARGSKMTLSSVCLDVSSMFDFHQIKLAYRCVYPSSNQEDDFFCLVNYLNAKKGGMGLMPSTSVNLEVIGPCKVEFKSDIVGPSTAKKSVDGVFGGSSINIFGVVMPVDNFMGDDVPYRYADAFLSEEEENDSGMIESETENASGGGDDKNGQGDGAVDGKNDDTVASLKPTKKRKLEEENKTDDKASKLSTTTATAVPTTPAPAGNSDKKLTKSQRKKLAREKAKQLEETLSAARNDNKNDDDDDDGDDDDGDTTTTNNNNAEEPAKKKSKKKKKKSSDETKSTSMTRERRLPGGLLISDMILGTGPPVKPGKRISLHYTGSLRSNGHVFDKNNSKQHPLVFRQGTGEVIRGLERGLEGMKVGGERVVTVPSKLGYGK
eukprot:CAMPEP_0201664446 /NCGR_PEP_ID=MMETSP0494-20130426/5910_1 /ASSEMBLY_ACC=CAM_ASM_000839 /TAXON_ID=420259 /ORGANISM="Thalassiosira gravida, Strain GMp14c1" /LENGTH=473 /DNA_ID=CAMNT_0048143215 /DNA_START=49 /DNA_END=1467 /DNA_ORIENTATION=-